MNINLNNKEKEYFTSPVNYRMGPYSNLELNNDNYNVNNVNKPKYNKKTVDKKCKWRKKPCNVKLHSDVKFVAPVGIESRYVEDPDHSKSFPV